MTEWMPRTAWTSSDASGDQLSGSRLKGVAVHWPGTTQHTIGDAGANVIARRLRRYRDYHLSRGWRDIGYNLAIDQGGRVWQLRTSSWAGDLVGAHCASTANPDANLEWVGVLLLVGLREDPSTKMLDAFGEWHHSDFVDSWGFTGGLRGHRQVPGAQTACPGDRVIKHLGTLLEGDMATAEEIADAVWARRNTTNEQLPGWMIRQIFEAVGGYPVVSVDGHDWSIAYTVQRIWHLLHEVSHVGIDERQQILEQLDVAITGERDAEDVVRELADVLRRGVSDEEDG